MNRGIWYAVGAYVIWGLFPAYWKALKQVPATQLIGHRIFWSFLMLCVVVTFSRRWKALWPAAMKPVSLAIYFFAAMLLAVNWLVYVWAVNSGFIVQTSLGYFINPLVSVLIGVIFLRERLRPWQWIAVGLVTGGILYLTFAYGALPWIALALALTFGGYGLAKKIAPLGSVFGLTIETGLLTLPALLYLLYCGGTGQGAFSHGSSVSDGLMIGAGLVTTVPLLMFATAAQRIPLSLIGILQYVAPTLQFLVGVLVYREPFTNAQAVGFGIVWLALVIFGIEGIVAHRARAVAEVV